MEGHGARLNRKMESVIAALLTQRNQEEAERAVDISPATLLRWLKLPEFQKAYREARRAAHDQSIARLQQGTSAAVSTLLKVMVDPTTLASTKVRAADSVWTTRRSPSSWKTSTREWPDSKESIPPVAPQDFVDAIFFHCGGLDIAPKTTK